MKVCRWGRQMSSSHARRETDANQWSVWLRSTTKDALVTLVGPLASPFFERERTRNEVNVSFSQGLSPQHIFCTPQFEGEDIFFFRGNTESTPWTPFRVLRSRSSLNALHALAVSVATLCSASSLERVYQTLALFFKCIQTASRLSSSPRVSGTGAAVCLFWQPFKKCRSQMWRRSPVCLPWIYPTPPPLLFFWLDINMFDPRGILLSWRFAALGNVTDSQGWLLCHLASDELRCSMKISLF